MSNIGSAGDSQAFDYASLRTHWTFASGKATHPARLPVYRAGATDFTGSWSDPIVDQQSDVLPFPEGFSEPVANHPLSQYFSTPAYPYLEDPDFQFNIPPLYGHHGHQYGEVSFDTDFQNGLMDPPNQDYGFGFQMSPAWMPQDTFPDQQNMLGLSATLPDAAGSLAAAPTPASAPAASTLPQAAVNHRIHCPKGCAGTFGRPGDYRRHMKKHDTPKFKCPVYDCDKTFYRGDKLRDHIKQGHKHLKSDLIGQK